MILLTTGGDEDARRSGSEIPGPTSVALSPPETETLVDQSIDTPVIIEAAEPPAEIETEFERTETGARMAAVSYLEATEEAVILSPQAAASLQRAMATTAFAEEFGADTEQRMTELVEAIPGGITLRVASIEARSVADGDDWLVSIWYVQAITITGESVVDDWRTASYRMSWEANTWKIASFESKRGPVPGRGSQAPSATPSQFEALLAGFSDDGLN